jgi:hypothetical protein
VVSGLLLVPMAGLLGCPQLLDDSFDTVRIAPDAGELPSINVGGNAGAAGAGGSGVGGNAGNGGSGSTGTGGTDAGGSAGASGSAGSGSGGTGGGGTGGSSAGTAGTGGSAAGSSGTGGTSSDTPACWTFELTTQDADSDSNCVGVDGWNQITVDTANSSVVQSYTDGDICFNGTISATGWGATYNYALAGGGEPDDGDAWDATAAGVTGFELTTTGNSLPASFEVTYSVNRDDVGYTDYCQDIGTGPALVPFTGAARENCSGSNTGALTDLTELEFLRLSFPVTGIAYAVDFCLRIRALQ